jgi:hypothetical protein
MSLGSEQVTVPNCRLILDALENASDMVNIQRLLPLTRYDVGRGWPATAWQNPGRER